MNVLSSISLYWFLYNFCHFSTFLLFFTCFSALLPILYDGTFEIHRSRCRSARIGRRGERTRDRVRTYTTDLSFMLALYAITHENFNICSQLSHIINFGYFPKCHISVHSGFLSLDFSTYILLCASLFPFLYLIFWFTF